jgi:hypothetical protein
LKGCYSYMNHINKPDAIDRENEHCHGCKIDCRKCPTGTKVSDDDADLEEELRNFPSEGDGY